MSEKSPDMREKALRLMEALSQVDEELLVRSEQKGHAGMAGSAAFFFRRYGGLIAACFVFAVLGTCFFGVYTVVFMRAGGDSSGQAEMELALEDTPAENGMNGMGGMNAASVTDNTGGMDGTNDTGARDDIYEMSGKKEAGTTAVSGEESQRDTVGSSADSESQKIQYPENENQEAVQESLFQSQDKQDNSKDNLMIDQSGCLADPRKEITLEEALKDERLGGYIPTIVPAGYKILSVRQGNADASDKELTLTWERGMDSIMLYITDYYAIAKGMQGTNELVTVDISKPETYDVRMYEIPYGETVPEEYRTVFDDPVFKSSELSLELVEARMKSVADRGDTDTPRGNFSVLYDSGVLIRFNGRGTAREIWEMFQSIDQP